MNGMTPSKQYTSQDDVNVLRCGTEEGASACTFIHNEADGAERWQQLAIKLIQHPAGGGAERIARLRENRQWRETTYQGFPAFSFSEEPDDRDVNPCVISVRRGVIVIAGDVELAPARWHVCQEEPCGECSPAPARPLERELDVLFGEALRAGLFSPGAGQ